MPIPKFELDVKKMPDLYDRIAFEIAKCFVGKDRRKGVSKSQIRKIFDEAKALGRSLKDSLEDSEKDSDEEKWKEIYPLIKMIKVKTAYIYARASKESREYYKNLYDFITYVIDKVKNYNDFSTFNLLFEAVYGYYYGIGGKE